VTLRVTALEARETPAGFRAIGAGPGAEPFVTVERPDGTILTRFLAYDDAFRGGVRAVLAPLVGSPGDLEVVTGAGPGGGPHVKVFRIDAAAGGVITAGSFFAYDPGFRGGINVALGDLTGDGLADVLTGAGPGGGPHVKAFDGRTGAVLRSFMAFDPGFRGGVAVAIGELDGSAADGPELAAAAGPGGGPHVRVVHADGSPFASFFAFPASFTGGVMLGSADEGGLVAGAGQPGSVVAAVQFTFSAGGGVAGAALDLAAAPGLEGLAAGADPATIAVPLTGLGNAYWEARAQQIAARPRQGHASVLFLGDSILEHLQLGAGQPVWNQFYAPLGAADFAVSMATTAQVLWQVQSGQAAAVTPDVVVLLIGVNNLWLNQTPGQTAAGIATAVNRLELALPQARIVLLGLLPPGMSPADPRRSWPASVNPLIASLADGRRVRYLDVGPALLWPDGSIPPAVISDGIHPTLLGYQLITRAMWPTLTAALAGV
jgi:lysophospholipase L1-like esterase